MQTKISRYIRSFSTVVLGAGLVLAVTIAVGNLHQNEDLSMALLAGRDVLEGNLAKPDQWSFTTDGKIWVNQGWLSGLVFYLSYARMHEAGPVLIKAILLAACIGILYRRCRDLSVPRHVAILSVTLATLSVAPLQSIRAENFGVFYFVILSWLLARAPNPGMWRHAGSVAIIALWANSHGTFLVGFALIAAKAGMQFFRSLLLPKLSESAIAADGLSEIGAGKRGRAFSGTAQGTADAVARESPSSEAYKLDSLKWMLVLLLCVPVMALANPYGPANLYMPFRQTGAEVWTNAVELWQPLIKLDPNHGMVLYMGEASLLYLFLAILFLVLCVLGLVVSGPRESMIRLLKGSCPRDGCGDLLMEVTIAVGMILLALRFGRTVVFAGLALVPTLGFLIRDLSQRAQSYLEQRFGERASSATSLGLLASSLALFGSAAWFFFSSTVPPYLPNNPLFERASPVERAFGTSAKLKDLTQFVKDNPVRGRVYADLLLSDLLLLHVPGLQVFMDLRAQSMYSDATGRAYLTVAHVDPANRSSVQRALDTLDRHSVSAVIVPTDSEYWLPLIHVLLTGKAWLPVYVDTSGFVFVRADSPLLGSFRQTGRVTGLRYRRERARLLTEAYLMGSTGRGIRPEVIQELKDVSEREPCGLAYQTIARSAQRSNGCLGEGDRLYFEGEIARLRAVDFIRPGGYEAILGSMLTILKILDANARSCGSGEEALVKAEGLQLLSVMDRVRGLYQPWPSN
jgi:hypothetical protein